MNAIPMSSIGQLESRLHEVVLSHETWGFQAMDRHQFTYSKNNAKEKKEMVMAAIGSALNNTINDWIMLFGDSEEDVHLFQGR